MTTRELAEVGLRLEEAAVLTLPEPSLCSSAVYAHYEMLAIQILDSEHADFSAGTLESYLTSYLADLRKRLGLQ